MTQQLLLLPGLLCDRTVWREQIANLKADWDCQVPVYENEVSITDMADRVLEEGGARFALAGHSMGGRVALEVVRKAPERVTHLALLDTGYSPLKSGKAGRQEIDSRQALVHQARTEGMRAMGWEWMKGMVHPERLNDAALCEQILAMIASKTPDQFAGQQEALIGRPDATPVLESLTCPVQFICGRQDSWSPLERHFDMSERVPDTDGRTPGERVTAIEESGHMSTMERPDQVSTALRALLSR